MLPPVPVTSQLSGALLFSLTHSWLHTQSRRGAAIVRQTAHRSQVGQWAHLTENKQKASWVFESHSVSRIVKVKTSHTDSFGGQTVVRSTGRTRLSVQRGVFKQDLIGKMFGTGQNRSLKRGVRLSRVFGRRGSTVYINAKHAVLLNSLVKDIHQFLSALIIPIKSSTQLVQLQTTYQGISVLFSLQTFSHFMVNLISTRKSISC